MTDVTVTVDIQVQGLTCERKEQKKKKQLLDTVHAFANYALVTEGVQWLRGRRIIGCGHPMPQLTLLNLMTLAVLHPVCHSMCQLPEDGLSYNYKDAVLGMPKHTVL